MSREPITTQDKAPGTEEPKKKIQPTVEVKARTESISDFQPKPGFFHFIRLDKDGNEMSGTDFEVGPNTAHTYLKRETQFKLKKSPTKP